LKEIRKIITEYDTIDHSIEKVALASVVNVEASSYRRIGARMLVRNSGMWTGGISGGCLEGDALKRSQKAIFKNAASNVVYDTMEDDKNQIGVGLGCNGRIEVLFTPIDPSDPENEIEQLRKIIDSDTANLILKIIDCPDEMSILGKSKLIENNEAVQFANIDSSELKNIIVLAKSKKSATIVESQISGKKINILAEFIRPETKLIVVGDNYDVSAILELAQVLGWKSTLVGKAKKLSKHIFSLCEKVLDYPEAHEISVNEYTAVILMSHDYNHDKDLLPIFLEKKPGYLGMLGPKKRYLKMQKQLGLAEHTHNFFFSPTGLEIGAESPEEIALSMMSEILAHMRKKQGGFLRDKEGSIHS